jgi:hypothetical protein
MGRDKAYPETAGASEQPSALIADRDLRRLFDYWCGRRKGRLMPSLGDIDPLDIGWALSRIFLVDYSPGAGFVYRLAGDSISRVFGHGNLKGLNLRDVVKPERLEQVEGAWLRVVEERAVVSMKGQVYFGANRTPIGERLLLPLAEGDAAPVSALLGMTVCQWIAGEVPAELKQAQVEALPVSEIP